MDTGPGPAATKLSLPPTLSAPLRTPEPPPAHTTVSLPPRPIAVLAIPVASVWLDSNAVPLPNRLTAILPKPMAPTLLPPLTVVPGVRFSAMLRP